MQCLGCYTAIPEEENFCKTCLDRRKAPREVKLSDPNALAPSQDFEGFSGPESENTVVPVRIFGAGAYQYNSKLEGEELLSDIMKGGLRAEDSAPQQN